MQIDVAKELAVCVKQLNGIVGDDLFKGSNDPSNADYWFPDASVLAELKCLTENLLSKEGYKNRTEKMYKSWVQRGLVQKLVEPKKSFNLQEIPEECALEFLKPIKRQFDDHLGKANRQIRKSKEFFDAPNAKGLLLLVNDGNHAFPPSMITYLLLRSMKNQFSSIDSVIYFSANEPTSVPGFPSPQLFWIDILIPDREPVSSIFRESLHEAWMNHYSTLIKSPAVTFTLDPSPTLLDGMKFGKPSGSS
jgi:hypothetical protein